jgi:membrane-associated HD superfamily phosphohydrolase
MLADGCEARARAELPVNENELREVVNSVIDYCQREGQLDFTNMTLNDLKNTADSFVKALLNAYHPRLKYPEEVLPAKTRKNYDTDSFSVNLHERHGKKK